MKVQLTLKPFPWRTSPVKDPPNLAKLRDKLHEMFASYQPRRVTTDLESYDYPDHELTVAEGDPNFEKLLKELDGEIRRTKPPVVGTMKAFLAPDEVKRARFLELFFYTSDVDRDANGRPLNPPKAVLCATCKFPDITKVPRPLLLGNGALKKYEIFGTSAGLIVVRSRIKELLEKAIGNQIEIGEAVLAKPQPKGPTDDKFFWVRPKEMIGDELLKRFPKKCPKCGRPRECRVLDAEDLTKKGGPKLYDLRQRVEHFGGGKSDLAVLGGYYGEILDDGRPSWHWPMAMSGALFTFLKTNGLKGFAASAGSDPVECLVSAKAEPFLEPQAREFGAAAQGPKPARQKSAKPAASSGKTLASFKNVPWDCDDDGFVHFYLTGPELMVVDPMTWEEDSGASYRIKNFTGPGLYRLHVSSIKDAEGQESGVAVDSATLLLIDNEFYPELQDAYEWEKAANSRGDCDEEYHNQIAEKIGNRFAICTTPPAKFKSDFRGDGFYRIDVKAIKRAG